MALVKCRECGAQISTKAASCPSCGAKVRKTSLVAWLALGVVVLSVVGAMFGKSSEGGAPQKSREQTEAEKADNARAGVALALAKTIRDAAKDPDSIKFHSVRVSNDTKTACADFTGRNGFGGATRSSAVLVGTQISMSAEAWNKHCLAAMPDYTYMAR